MPFLLLSQSTGLDGLTGSGWAGAGLLGLVLGWLLLVHLPAKDKLLLQLIESKDKALAANDAKVDGLVTAFREELSSNRTEIMKHCKDELARVVTAKVEELFGRQPKHGS